MNHLPFTVQDIAERVRYLKNDAGYSIDKIYRWSYDALLELHVQAPKTRRSGDSVYDLPKQFTAATDAFPCLIDYMPLIVDYVLARAFMGDGNSQEHAARSQIHFELFFKRAHWIEYGPQPFADRALASAKGRS